ncbi:cobalamin-dependent protein [Bacteroidales bacterium]|nr:cobalamin-dependent protein [Bacteroidales bacterium]
MDTKKLLAQLSLCVEKGKISKDINYPPEMNGQDGASELTMKLLELEVKADIILNDGMVPGMNKIGELFSQGKVFIPSLLTAAKAMNAGLEHIKPYFASGEIKRKGKFILGTVQGDLHDIGKNLVGFAVEGAGWEVIDLGTNVTAEMFVETLKAHPTAVVGLSALLTITMTNMKGIIDAIKAHNPNTKVIVGGAPLTQEFSDDIGADHYSQNPHHAVLYLKDVA